MENTQRRTDGSSQVQAVPSTKRKARQYKDTTLIIYDVKSDKFSFPKTMSGFDSIGNDAKNFWTALEEYGFATSNTIADVRMKLEEIAAAETQQAHFMECYFKSAGADWHWYYVGLMNVVPGTTVNITITDIDDEIEENSSLSVAADRDELTGLYNRNAFVYHVDEILKRDFEGVAAGEYAVVYFDVLRFKAVNDLFGMTEGDRLLIHIADVTRRMVKEEDIVCRFGSDRFVFFTHTSGEELEQLIENILEEIGKHDLPFIVNCNVGIYVTRGAGLIVNSMIDRAVLAQSSIKGSYTTHFNYYSDELRDDMLGEQEIVGMMEYALAQKQFIVYYQPQYDHSTGMLVGAEALVRWKHPERGLISPGVFIPIFEKNGFITKLDLYVFEQVCIFLRKCLDNKWAMVPISTNFSRHDIFQKNFTASLENIRKKYDIQAKYLRVEITESVIVGSSQHVNEVVRSLHECGYVVEMDDFGSGYSSLNVLKDIELDIIKLDMLFLSDEEQSNRGGTILSSVVRMAKWLGMPVIAEGVEQVRQADFLRSIGCDYIQGYLYSKPLPEEEYQEYLKSSMVGAKIPQMRLIEGLNAFDFWDPKSLETLIFSNYVGGAAIFEYHDGKVEILRVNQKYLQEVGMNLTEKQLIESDPMAVFDETNEQIYCDMLNRAIESMEEEECETWRNISSDCCGNEHFCIRTNARVIGRSGDSYLFYAMIRNITTEKEHLAQIENRELGYQRAFDEVDIYYWEYVVATHEMKPCFRCMRDLGLPPLLTNYPDSAIEQGVFPPEVADMYRDWHRQIEKGVPHLEAMIPLTMDRIPFYVRYTTEFDDNGRAVKAYGSAVKVTKYE